MESENGWKIIRNSHQGDPTSERTSTKIDEEEVNLENNKEYQEWKACNDSITRLDSILIDLRKYGFSVATGLTTAGSVLGMTQFSQFQPFQIVLIFATMALIDVLYWLDVYYQTILSAVILRTQVLERKLGFGLDIYISRFYMRHKIGKALHLLHIGFLVSLLVLGVYIVLSNDLVSQSGISISLWILFLLVPIIFVFCIWGFFDRRRYKTYRKAQEIVSNFLRNPSVYLTPLEGRTIDQEIIEFLDSDKEDLGLDLESNEWVYFDEKERKWWLRLWLWSRRLIVSNKRIYPIKTSIWRTWVAFIDFSNTDDKVQYQDNSLTITKAATTKSYFKIKISKETFDKIFEQITKEKAGIKWVESFKPIR